ncbi:MAG: hypothetical protein KJ550_08155 [Proteobacteria bacterium]|nr:hypothetical protein [Pseudomonadota bacterium]MBU4013424.1 hypothetical protein [Pseudomonadota bacterium]MBU4066927.1 hypothetical protein [Pseudomonadota bacterium]MBU4208867.1 hypothetical protein [Pseudomonadota bacterium]MCG2829862.1 hypothetical protein [Desulfobacteraceae bacterium]
MTDYSKTIKSDASEPSKWEAIDDFLSLLKLATEANGKNIQIQEKVILAKYLYEANSYIGNQIILSKEYGFCPGLIDGAKNFIPLFSLIEVVDELIDYDRIIQELPGISYSQINGAISFLRKVAQFNIKNIDIDDTLDDELAANDSFLSELRKAFADKEDTRVLNFG